MIRKLAVVAFCFLTATPAWAQADPNNPFMEMARKFVQSHDFWQDEKFQHAYDSYFECYEKAAVGGKVSTSAPRAATDALFHNAYTSCGSQRVAGTAAADSRILEFHPEMSADERSRRTEQYRRNLAVLRLGETFQSSGLAKAYSDYFDRTSEF